MTAPAFLRRYTDLPAVLRLLGSQQLTLLDPKTWDDRNDAHFMALYKERLQLKSLLALCFSQTVETYHHWRVFSGGPSGVCIVFDRDSLLAELGKTPGVMVRDIEYLSLAQARERQLRKEELPFVKRHGFRPERELRVVYASTQEERATLDIPIPLGCIRSISLSPWMHPSLAPATVAAIRAIRGCSRLRVSRSTLISNEQWKALGNSAI